MRWFFGFFLVSGFCSLVYEVIWLRLAMAKFGVTTPMVSIVLSVFMAGLALGSWAGGKIAKQFGNSSANAALRVYGLIELVIGFSSLLVPVLIDAGSVILQHMDLPWDSPLYYVGSAVWTTISLLPWCTCMGATFPIAMASFRKTCSSDAERSFSYLYLANVLGAVLGTIV